jgi:hypothetical protein
LVSLNHTEFHPCFLRRDNIPDLSGDALKKEQLDSDRSALDVLNIPQSFGGWIDYYFQKQSTDKQRGLSLRDFENMGLPLEMIEPLKELVRNGEEEEEVVVIFLWVLKGHISKDTFSRNTRRSIEKAYKMLRNKGNLEKTITKLVADIM